MQKTQQGFTLIELMIVVAIMGLLASMAIPSYSRYTIRAQVAEGLVLAGPLQVAAAEYFNQNGAYPADNDEAGVPAADEYQTSYVDNIAIAGDTVLIEYGNRANQAINGSTLTLTADGSAGKFSWDCSSVEIAAFYLPDICR